jgi:hypothetical protein
MLREVKHGSKRALRALLTMRFADEERTQRPEFNPPGVRDRRPDLCSQGVDQGQRASALDVPEGPAVARFETLGERADAVNRADSIAERDRAIGPHQRPMTASRVELQMAFRKSGFTDTLWRCVS